MLGPEGFGAVHGDSGEITVAGGAKAGIIKTWNIRRSGTNLDGTPRLRFKAQFSWLNETLMNLPERIAKKRIVLSMRSKIGFENVDIVAWEEARLEGGVLILENITKFDGVRKR